MDISLARLTDIIKNLSVGNTGYVMLLQGDGTIISDPKFPDHNFKKLSDLNLPDYDRIGNTTQGTLYGVDIAGTIYGCKVETSAKTGWKLVALIEEQELHAASGKIITHILVIAVSVLLVSAFLGSLFVTRGVIRPINALVSMTQDISAGKYDAIPRQAAFKSEFKILFDNMKLIVEKLVSTIASNEKKTLEADEKTLQATTALAEAAEARKQAEHARAEGMLQAAPTARRNRETGHLHLRDNARRLADHSPRRRGTERAYSVHCLGHGRNDRHNPGSGQKFHPCRFHSQ